MKADEIRILVIEDNPNWVNKTRQILRHLGYANVRTSANAEEARATFKEFDPHLAVVDIMLPEDEDGFDLIKEMRDADPRMHIIAVSALESSDTPRNACFSGGWRLRRGHEAANRLELPAIAKNSKRRRQWQEKRAWAAFSSKRAGGRATNGVVKR